MARGLPDDDESYRHARHGLPTCSSSAIAADTTEGRLESPRLQYLRSGGEGEREQAAPLCGHFESQMLPLFFCRNPKTSPPPPMAFLSDSSSDDAYPLQPQPSVVLNGEESDSGVSSGLSQFVIAPRYNLNGRNEDEEGEIEEHQEEKAALQHANANLNTNSDKFQFARTALEGVARQNPSISLEALIEGFNSCDEKAARKMDDKFKKVHMKYLQLKRKEAAADQELLKRLAATLK